MSRFSKAILVLLALFLVEAPVSQAQDRYAAFIHGFTPGDDRGIPLEDKGNYIRASGTPGQWKGNVIGGSILLRYYDRDLYGTGSTLDQTRQDMMERFVNKMKETAPEADWVLVGHSQGGIVARLLHEYIRKNAPGLNVEGVLAIASPMQGAKATKVSYGSRSGYINVKPIVNGFIKDLLKGPTGDTVSGLLRFAIPPIGFLFDIVANIWDPNKFVTDGVIDLLESKLKAMNELAVNKNAKQAIGPTGDLIENINRAENPDAYRALLGAERAPTLARLASAPGYDKVTFDPLATFGLGLVGSTSLPNANLVAEIFRNNESVSPGEEPRPVKFFRDIKDGYASAADYYRYRCYATFGLSCLGGDYRKWKRWKQGREAIQGFESTYTEIVNSFRLETRSYEERVCYGSAERPYKSSRRTGGAFSPPSAEEYVHPRLPDECYSRTRTYTVTVPQKNDGLLGTNTTSWDRASGDQATNLGPHSILYNDRPSSNQYKRGGTGYNHAEMLYNRRRYSASEDPGIADGKFSEGQRNPPMRNAEEWVEDALEGR